MKPQNPNLPDLSKTVGMSEPFSFAFNITDQKKNEMLCHTVIFSSFRMAGEREISLVTRESDPRMEHLIHYIWANWLKEAKGRLEKQLAELEAMCDERKKKLEGMDEQLEQLKRKAT